MFDAGGLLKSDPQIGGDVSDGPILSLAREKIGEKSVRGVRGLYRSTIQAGNRFASFFIRTGALYERFGTRRPLEWASNLFLSAFEWVRSIETASEISRIVRICTGQTASPGGSWLREAQTDEGQYAPNICTAASIVLPDPHLALRATFPQGKAFLVQTCQLSRERSKKTEAVFLVGLRESEGKSKSPQALFLLPAFSFGEAKENAGPQSQICRRASALQQCRSKVSRPPPPLPSVP